MGSSLHHSDLVIPQLINLKMMINIQLHKAAKAGQVDNFISVLGKFSIPPPTILNLSTPLKNTLIHIAANFNNLNLVHYLLKQCPEFLNQANYKDDTAFHIAAREGHLEVIKALIDFAEKGLEGYGASISLVNEDGNTPLHEAMIHGREKVVDYFLQVSSSKGCSFGIYVNNKEGKSPFYLAVEAGNVENVKTMLKFGSSLEQITCGKSLIHAAIVGKNLALLQELAKVKGGALVYVEDESQQSSLHCASSVGFLAAVKYLLKEFDMDVYKKDKDGFCPIHLASKNGHVDIIDYFLQHYPDAREFVDSSHKNILHIAAENGKDAVVNCILKSQDSELLINERDRDGNTCLHLATGKWHPKVVSSLTWDKRMNVKLANNAGLTALEVAETSMLVMAPFRQRLTWMALMSSGAARAGVQDMATINRLKAVRYEPYSVDYCKDRVNTLLLVAALVATITFAAGFAMPGGSNASNTNQGIKIMLHDINLITFMICDFLAFCSSITVVVILMWAQLGDLNLLLNALRLAQKGLGFSLTMTTIAFMVGIHLLLNKLVWLGIVVLVMGILSVASLLALCIPLFLPYTSNVRIARYISYYPFYVLMMASESYA